MKINYDYRLTGISKVMLTFCLLFMMFFLSCEKDKENKIYFYLRSNPATLDIPSSGVTETYTVYSNGSWKVEPSSAEDWVTIDPLEGNGDGFFTVIAKENHAMDERELTLQFIVNGKPQHKVLQLTQAGEEQVFRIEGDPIGLDVDIDGATQTYTVNSNGIWRIELLGEAGWVSINPTEGVHDGTFTITVDANTALDSRSANVAFYLNGKQQSTVFVINQKGTLVDIDGNGYETVIIGGREWMKENLKVTHYRNGNPISTGLTNAAWSSTTSGAYAIYPYAGIDGIASEEEMVATYGLLYNMHAVNSQSGLCPEGWRVPTDDDWQQLEIAAGMSPEDASKSSWRGSPVGFKLKGIGGGWIDSDNNTDDFGFSVYPIGAREASGNYDARIGQFAFFWTTTPNGTNYTRRAFQVAGTVNKGVATANAGYSIRCVRIP